MTRVDSNKKVNLNHFKHVQMLWYLRHNLFWASIAEKLYFCLFRCNFIKFRIEKNKIDFFSIIYSLNKWKFIYSLNKCSHLILNEKIAQKIIISFILNNHRAFESTRVNDESDSIQISHSSQWNIWLRSRIKCIKIN